MEVKGITLPDGLKDLTVRFMEGIIETFDKENKLNSLDTLSLYLLADNFDIYLECADNIRKNGLVQISDRGNTSLSPFAVQQKQVQNSILSLLKELGLTLGSRTKIKVIDNTDENNPLLNFLKNDRF